MNINKTIITALTGIAAGGVFSMCKPVNADPDEYIVFNPENEYLDYGDDVDTEAEMSMQVHYYHRGLVNYKAKRKAVRDALREAGFVIEPSPFAEYETVNNTSQKNTGTAWTHFCIVCRAEDD